MTPAESGGGGSRRAAEIAGGGAVGVGGVEAMRLVAARTSWERERGVVSLGLFTLILKF